MNARVEDYWVHQEGWDWTNLTGLLPTNVERKLIGYMLTEDSTTMDTTNWSCDPSGKFTVTSAYNIIHNCAGNGEDKTWKRIWKLKIPSKIKTFLWLAYHQRLMSNDMRVRQGFAASPYCHNCPGVKEDVSHILRECPKAREVWRKITPCKANQNNWLKPYLAWFRENVNSRSTLNGTSEWSILFVVVTWWL